MRDIALTLFFVGVLVFAVRRTWIAVLLWTWMSLMNPHKMTWGFALTAPFAQVTALVAMISLVLDHKNLRMPRDPVVLTLALFVVWMGIATFNAIHVSVSTDNYITVLKIQLMTFIAFLAIRERKHIEAFVWIIVISVGFYGFKGGLFTIATGGSARVWGPQDTYINGNNEIGLALTMIIPLANYLRQVSPYKWVRRGLLVLMLLSAVAVLGTQSRGALLAIVAMTLVLWARSSRKLVGGIVMIGLAIGLVAFMPKSWEERMSTIKSYEEDGSAMSRLNSWEMAINLANDRITGGGFYVETAEVFQRYAPDPKWIFTAHSIYFQALGEQGWIGLFLFLVVGAGTWLATMQMRRQGKRRPETLWAYELGGMIQVSMVGYAVGGAFLSLTYLDLAYNISVVAVAAKWWLRAEGWKTEPQGLFNSGAPVGRLPKIKKVSAHAAA